MVDNNVFDDDVLSQFSIKTAEFSQGQVEIEKDRIKEIEKVKINTEFEIARRTQETQIRVTDNRREHWQNGFHLTKQVQLVPQFSEEDIDKYFLQFEKVAFNLS